MLAVLSALLPGLIKGLGSVFLGFLNQEQQRSDQLHQGALEEQARTAERRRAAEQAAKQAEDAADKRHGDASDDSAFDQSFERKGS